jgi:hypothetical protein
MRCHTPSTGICCNGRSVVYIDKYDSRSGHIQMHNAHWVYRTEHPRMVQASIGMPKMDGAALLAGSRPHRQTGSPVQRSSV